MSAYTDLAESFGKRTVNKFKSNFFECDNYSEVFEVMFYFKDLMLNKDSEGSLPADIEKEIVSRFYIPRTTPKRGAILSWAIPAANRL